MLRKFGYFASGLLLDLLIVAINFLKVYALGGGLFISLPVSLFVAATALVVIYKKRRSCFYWVLAGTLLWPFIAGGLILLFLVWGFSSFHLPDIAYPDKEETIAVIERYRTEHGRYPDTLKAVGIKADGQWVRYDRSREDVSFSLCYVHPTPVGTDGACYESKTGKWRAR